jgi:signal transduction histidine kinase
VAIFAWDSRKGRYVAGAWQGVDEGLAEVCSFSKKHGMVRWLLEHQQLLTRSKLGKAFPHDVAVEVATDMDALRAEVIMPLLERGNLVAFLSLGTKMTGKRYDEEDLELLAVIGDCASGAISTSLLHREISFQKAMAEAVLKNIACGIVVVDGEAKIVSVNYFAESALDLNSAELVGRSVQKLGSVLADMVLRTTKEDQTFVNRPYQDKATGRVFAVSTCRMYEDTLGAAAVILFFTPLPEVPSIVPEEGKLLEDEKFSSFCGHIADRVKNPLASIKTFSQLLPEKFDDTEFREKFSQIVGRAVERINSLADGLTAYAGTGPLDLAPTNIGAVIENTVAGLRKNLHARKLHVAGPGSDKPAMALADGQLIRSAFLNVLKNSIESTTADGSITISVKKVSAKELREEKARDASRALCDNTGITGKDGAVPDDEMFVETEFRDSGKGIAEAEMGKVGEPFFTTKGESIGLGMAIVRKIVGRHRGKMEIESKEGIGTTVRIILRAEQNAR